MIKLPVLWKLCRCHESAPLMASCTARLGHQWLWSQQVCSARHHNVTELRAALQRKRVHFLGDSHGRNCYTWLKLHLEGALCCCQGTDSMCVSNAV